MKKHSIATALLAFSLWSLPAVSHAQEAAPAARTPLTTAAIDPNALCCGEVSKPGQLLDRVIDSMHVDALWQPQVHINWLTGQQDEPASSTGPDRATHCSSFTAALGYKLDIYMLRPPDHPQQLLASAQAQWFNSKSSGSQGWEPVATAAEAQSLANAGELVTVVYESPDPHRPGHIAIVRPIAKTNGDLLENGVQTAQAGARNFSSGVARISFAKHKGAWPDEVRYYAHPIDWPTLIAKWQTMAKQK
ncbi:MAG: hypothetical protein PW792_14620 [Acidobacteriaceae bacterium]|nr:hypothetical protein [Acidobacteriaceae bacterium]